MVLWENKIFLTIQFPLVDARKFVDHVDLLGSPGWPLPTPNFEFVRFFGTIRDRKHGGITGWIGEDQICKADKALVFTKYPSAIKGGTRIAFRRFYFDGWAVGKYEICLKFNPLYSPDNIKDLGSYIPGLPVRVRSSLGAPIDCELIQAGKYLARLYLEASTPTKRVVSEKDDWLVRSGTPLLLLELTKSDNFPIPKDAKTINLPNSVSSLELYHYGVPYRGGKIYMWIIRLPDKKNHENFSRTLRLYLLRLHAEHECLRLILQSISNKNIQTTRGTALSDNLQLYLDKAIKRITRYENKTDNANAEIAEMARHSMTTIRPGQLDLLMDRVNDYRRHLVGIIGNYAKTDASIINYGYMEVHKVENSKTYNLSNFQAGILNIESTLTNVSQNVGSIPNLDQSTKDELKQLIEQLNTALQKAPTEKIEEAEALAETTKDLVEDISKEKPNKTKIQITLSGLKQAAENIAKVLPDVLPIAVQVVSVITKTFGLG